MSNDEREKIISTAIFDAVDRNLRFIQKTELFQKKLLFLCFNSITSAKNKIKSHHEYINKC